MLPQKLAFVDIETTGLRSNYDRIIEIGIIRVENNKIVDTFESLINPQCHIPSEINVLTGITSKELEKAPTFSALYKDIKNILTGCIFVAHNVRFDFSFLKNEFSREDISLSSKQLCTVKLSRILYPEQARHNLDSIIDKFKFECDRRHRAMDDAQIIYKFYQRIQKSFPEMTIENAVNKLLKKPTIPIHLSQEDFTELPNSSGVYIFYDQENTPLYIGKSKSLKTRIQSHFSADYSSSIEMKISQQVSRISTIKTPGELGALIKESELIKSLQPIYNRKLRLSRKLIAAVKTNINGYDSVSLEYLDSFTPELLRSILGFFRSQKSAKDYFVQISRDYFLCDRLLGIEKTNSQCFGYRLGRCKGACFSLENPAFYNVRFLQSFSKTRIKIWPFNGPVAITEQNEDDRQTFILNNWCLERIINGESYDANYDELIMSDQEIIPFDLDIYKIFRGFINNPKNLSSIKQIPSNKHYFKTVSNLS